MWFTDVAAHPNPGTLQLGAFLENVRTFLAFSLEANELEFLWRDNRNLRAMAFQTFTQDVVPGIRRLQAAIPEIPDGALKEHGLLGLPLKFKLSVADTVGRRWDAVKRNLNVREWFARIIDAIDAILDSLIDAAGGAGGLIKEFKDALRALV